MGWIAIGYSDDEASSGVLDDEASIGASDQDSVSSDEQQSSDHSYDDQAGEKEAGGNVNDDDDEVTLDARDTAQSLKKEILHRCKDIDMVEKQIKERQAYLAELLHEKETLAKKLRLKEKMTTKLAEDTTTTTLRAAVASGALALSKVPTPMKADRALVLAALHKSRGQALEHAAEPLKSDAGVVLAALSACGTEAFGSTRECPIVYASATLLNDRRFMLRAVRVAPQLLWRVSKETSCKFHEDAEFILDALCIVGPSSMEPLKHARRKLRSDEAFMVEATECNHAAPDYLMGNQSAAFCRRLDRIKASTKRWQRATALIMMEASRGSCCDRVDADADANGRANSTRGFSSSLFRILPKELVKLICDHSHPHTRAQARRIRLHSEGLLCNDA